MLPENFPHKKQLEANGITELEQIPASKSELVGLEGIGSARADDIIAALRTQQPAAEALPIPETPAHDPEPGDHVSVKLTDRSAVSALIVGNTRITRAKPGLIPRAEFERLQSVYALEEAK